MKKFFFAMGLAVAGTASLQAANTPDSGSLSTTRLWNVSATLRGFYDDNYDTANSGANARGSYGFEVSPRIMLAVPLQQTELGLRNTYAMTYYEERDRLGQSAIDQSDQLDLWVDHAFTERWHAKVMDTFAVGQEPQLFIPNGQAAALLARVSGDNIRNTGTVTLNTDWTRLFSTMLSYQNSFYDYRNSGASVADVVPPFYGGNGTGSSLAGRLNRIDQLVSLDLQWRLAPQTIAFFGGAFEQVDFTADEPVAFNEAGYLLGPQFGPPIYYSSDRNNRSYFGYLGVQHNFLPNLNVSAKAGVQYSETYNDPLSSPTVAPYAVVSAVYTYNPGSYVQIGFTHARNATDVISPDPTTGKVTQDQESSVVYGSLNHLITRKLLGSLIGSWQYSTFHQGVYNDTSESFYSLGLNLSYTFTPHFSADAGYNFDDVQTDIQGRGYTRNRVYLGVTAAY
jgi:hypothetical protein